jgi:hypothetical protein
MTRLVNVCRLTGYLDSRPFTRSHRYRAWVRKAFTFTLAE